MLKNGFIFGPKLYSSDELSSNDEENSPKSDERLENEEKSIGERCGDMAPHEAYEKEIKHRQKNLDEIKMTKAQDGRVEARLADALLELEEATRQAHNMARCLQMSCRNTINHLVELDAAFAATKKELLAEKAELMEHLRDTNPKCARTIDEIHSTTNHVCERKATGYALFDSMESVRTALFQLNFHIDKLHQIVRQSKESAEIKRMLETEMDEVIGWQKDLATTLQAPLITQFTSNTWNQDVVEKNLLKLSQLIKWMEKINQVTSNMPEGVSIEDDLKHIYSNRNIIHNYELVPMMQEKRGDTDCENLSIETSPRIADNSFTFVSEMSLPSHLSYSVDSFVSAPEEATHFLGTAASHQPVEPISSRACVEITESETRPLFVNTTITEDKAFITPVPQSPLCPTAREIASVITAKTVDSQHMLTGERNNTSDCETAVEIIIPNLPRPKQPRNLFENVDENLVEPNDMLTVVEELATVTDVRSYNDLLSVLTARCISEEDLRTAVNTDSRTDVHTAREIENSKSVFTLASLLSCRARVGKERGNLKSKFSLTRIGLKWKWPRSEPID